MPIKFIKTPDPDNRYSIAAIEMTLPDQVGAEELMDHFEQFLLSMGYQPNTVNEMLNKEEG